MAAAVEGLKRHLADLQNLSGSALRGVHHVPHVGVPPHPPPGDPLPPASLAINRKQPHSWYKLYVDCARSDLIPSCHADGDNITTRLCQSGVLRVT
eukprot:3602299-Rhodomonas_salina.1